MRVDAEVLNQILRAMGALGVNQSELARRMNKSRSWLAEADIHADVRQKLSGHSESAIHALYTRRDASLARAIEVLPDLHAAAGKPAMETRRRRRS